MNVKALTALTLAAQGIRPKDPPPEAGQCWRVMFVDCLPYFRQRLDAAREDASTDPYIQEAIELVECQISAHEQGNEPPYIDYCNRLTAFYAFRLIGLPPSPDSAYFNRESVQQYLPYWNNEEWLIDDVIGNALRAREKANR